MRAETTPRSAELTESARALLGSLAAACPPEFGEHLRSGLAGVADPERALVRLDRFLDGASDAAAHRSRIASDAGYARFVLTLFDQSRFLTDIASSNPEYVTRLWDDHATDPHWNRADLYSELRQQLQHCAGFADQCAVMRRYYRREMLRIAARDIFGHEDTRSITRDLSDLADALTQAAFEMATADLATRFGTPQEAETDEPAAFVVLGMGKLGGRELNFSSDIDLIFIYSAEGETRGGERSVSNAEYYKKLGERIIGALTEQSAEGQMYRVDMRLRPHGHMAPLAASMAMTLEYFEAHGQAWERQALVRARAIAGDKELGESFLEQTRPFVFPRYFDDVLLEDIRRIKQRMEAEVSRRGETDREVKLGRGGIRDIEFTVQILQLLNGGRTEELRTPGTLDAIDALGRHGLLGPFEALTLARNYSFLRRVEHRLQIEGAQQVHVLPESPEALDDFARRLGYESGEAFFRLYRERAEEDRAILEQFFAVKGGGYLWLDELLAPNAEAREGLERLRTMGFADPEGARETLLDMCIGSDRRPNSAHVRQRFREIAPALLHASIKTADADAGLLQLGQLVGNIGAPGALFDIIGGGPSLADTLLLIISNSRFLSEIMIREPGLFETLGYAETIELPATPERLDEELTTLKRATNHAAALYRLRNGQMLRTGVRELLGRADVVQAGRELSMLADCCVREALRDARATIEGRYGAMQIQFGVIGLGKMGGMEMGYGSDLDLVFVYDAPASTNTDMEPSEYTAMIAAGLIRRLSGPTIYGALYDVDSRLRPDGNKGPLTCSLDHFREYYAHEGQEWERMALVKARVVAADEGFAERLNEAAEACAYGRPFSRAELEHANDIRKRLGAQAGPNDIKKGEGGIMELEFALRLLQIQDGRAELRKREVVEALSALAAAGTISNEDMGSLREAYIALRTIEDRIRMMDGRSESSLPRYKEEQLKLAARIGIHVPLHQFVDEHRTTIHAFYTRTYERLLAKA